MARDKLDPKKERQRQFHGFEVYRDLGYGRTFREVGRQVDAAPGTISHWAKIYNWDDRVKNYNAVVAKKEEDGALVAVGGPIAERVVTAMDRIESVIESAFVKEPSGKFSPRIEVKSVDELSKLIREYRMFLETYHRFVAEYMPDKKVKERTTQIDKLTQYFMGDLSQQERIDLMRGITNGNEPGGDKQSEGRAQDADFEQVPERRDEDGLGCDGVPGSSTDSSGGDETPVREP